LLLPVLDTSISIRLVSGTTGTTDSSRPSKRDALVLVNFTIIGNIFKRTIASIATGGSSECNMISTISPRTIRDVEVGSDIVGYIPLTSSTLSGNCAIALQTSANLR
jgi:hypothetical protein